MALSRSYPKGRRPSLGIRGALLLLLPRPLLFAALVALGSGAVGGFMLTSLGYAASLAAWVLARRGFRNDLHPVPHAPPFKSIAAGLTGLTATLAALAADYNLAGALLLGGASVPGFALAYGLESDWRTLPAQVWRRVWDRATRWLPSRRPPPPPPPDPNRAALSQARQALSAMETARRRIDNLELNARLARIGQQAGAILDLLESRPRDLRQARKFLKVYLEGARQVVEGYARTHRLNLTRSGQPDDPTRELETNFRNVLVTIEDNFQEQHQRLLDNQVLDLDVKIEVLSMQLKREGLR